MNGFVRAASFSTNYFINFQKIISHNRGIKTLAKVNKYLLNRSIPACDILNDLKEEDAEELNNIKIQYGFLLSSNQTVPQKLRDEDYLELLCKTKGQRFKYYNYLANCEVLRANDEIQNKLKIERNKQKDMEDAMSIQYRMFMQYSHSDGMKSSKVQRAFQSIALQEQEVVLDLSFEDEMTRSEVNYLAKQLLQCYSLNLSLEEPFRIVLTNVVADSVQHCDLTRHVNMRQEKFMVDNVEHLPWVLDGRHYLDIFPDRRLVYLSPNSTNFFETGEYDHEAVYIIGAIVDKSAQHPLTLARARRENIEHRAFPIDRFVSWKCGDKSLTMDQAMRALSIARETNGDWKKALLGAVPSRAMRMGAGRKNDGVSDRGP